MNKIYSSLSLILLLLTLGSCDSMFDNEIPPHDWWEIMRLPVNLRQRSL